MKQILARYSKQELTMLVLFVLIVIWLFSILSFQEPNFGESNVQDGEVSSTELVFNLVDEHE